MDKSNGKEVILTDAQMDLIQRIQKSEFPEETFDPYAVRSKFQYLIYGYYIYL